MKGIALLGSTGSIGTQSLDVCRMHGYRVVCLTANRRVDLMETQIREFRPDLVSMMDPVAADDLRTRVADTGTKVLSGMDGLIECATYSGADTVLNAVVGMVGLQPTLAAIQAKKTLALANKETLVAGGHLVTNTAKAYGVDILPVDSEHSAIFQCLQGSPEKGAVKKLILTASGGPFFGKTLAELENVTAADALKHPNWDMGAKITIDSATMMNKGLEVIEARWLFDVPASKIDVHVHPESIVHSMVEFADTSVIAQMGLPDMRIPISLALGYPKRLEYSGDSLDFFTEGANLHFEKPRMDVFRCLSLAYQAIEDGRSYPIALNGANEELVAMFLNKEIRFLDIQRTIERVLEAHNPVDPKSVSEILEIDREARRMARELAQG